MHSPELTRLIKHTYKICLTQNPKYSSLFVGPCRCVICISLKLALQLAKHKYYFIVHKNKYPCFVQDMVAVIVSNTMYSCYRFKGEITFK